MQKPNYEYAKRQKEIKRQKRNEEKRLRKLNKGKEDDILPAPVAPIDGTPQA